MKLDTLDGLVVFATVAETRNFRIAGERLGVSASAVSQTLRKLEERLGVALVHRTTRSVSLSEAGQRLYATVRPAVADVEAAIGTAGELSDAPRGTLRLLVGPSVDAVFAGSLLSRFLTAYPEVKLDVAVSDALVDVVAEGFDAGIQLGEVIDRDMIAVPVTGDIRMTVVGAPSYLARRGTPAHPRDLVEHECLNWHRTADAPPYRWEFTEPAPARTSRGDASQHRRDFTVAVPARVLSTDSSINIRLARDGLGLTIVYEDQVREEIARGELVPVLQEYCEPFPGYYLFYAQLRQASSALRALIEHLRGERRSVPKTRVTALSSATAVTPTRHSKRGKRT